MFVYVNLRPTARRRIGETQDGTHMVRRQALRWRLPHFAAGCMAHHRRTRAPCWRALGRICLVGRIRRFKARVSQRLAQIRAAEFGDSWRKLPQRGSAVLANLRPHRPRRRRGGKQRAECNEELTPCAGAAPQSLPSHGSDWYCQLEDANGTATGPDLPFSLMPRLGQGTGPRCATAIGPGFMQYPRPAKGLQRTLTCRGHPLQGGGSTPRPSRRADA